MPDILTSVPVKYKSLSFNSYFYCLSLLLSGRLTAIDKAGKSIESSDEKMYQTRNRAALCRCGRSRRKPYWGYIDIFCRIIYDYQENIDVKQFRIGINVELEHGNADYYTRLEKMEEEAEAFWKQK